MAVLSQFPNEAVEVVVCMNNLKAAAGLDVTRVTQTRTHTDTKISLKIPAKLVTGDFPVSDVPWLDMLCKRLHLK